MIWEVKERKFDDLFFQLLYNRGVFKNKDKKIIEKFLNPDFDEDLFDPYLLRGMKTVVSRINRTKDRGERVGVFADYDADGIPGGALLYKVLRKIGIECVVFIPSREGGYGLTKEGIDFLIEKKCTLIITVDLGIRNFTETDYCKKKNIDLIITDHHLPDEKIPKALKVINPKIKGNKYPFKELSGCGVVFKLAQALSKIYPKEITEQFLKWNLDLVAISTVADVVPLIGENRVIAKFGILVLRKTRNLGLLELYKVSNIDSEKIGSYEISFIIAPRINAPGRIDYATKSFELLVTEDKEEAKELAECLDEKNELRQKEMEKAEKEILAKIEKESLMDSNIIIVSGHWAKGILGPVASRIVEKFHRPTLIFSKLENEYAGSARSVEGINIVDIFTKYEKFIKRFGGHKGAAGLSIVKSNFLQFKNKILKYADKNIDKKLLEKKVKVDSEAKLSEINYTFAKKLSTIEPFGMGNRKPVFLSKDVGISYPRFVGQNKNHLSATIIDGSHEIKSIYFNFSNKEMIENHKKYDIVYSVNLDCWQGNEIVKLNIIDVKPND